MSHTEQNTTEMDQTVLAAFETFCEEQGMAGGIDTFFEHGQWWVRIENPNAPMEESTRTFSVVDSEGGPTIWNANHSIGLYFEEI